MNKIIYLFIIILFLSCSKKEQDNVVVAKWENKEIVKKETKKIEIKSDGKESYWFVIVQKKENEMIYNSIIKQNHSYFSVKEALNNFGNPKKYFLRNFKEVSEATFIDYHEKN